MENRLFDQILREANSFGWEDLIVQFVKVYFDAKKQIKRAKVYAAVNGTDDEFLAGDPIRVREAIDTTNKIQGAIEIIQEDVNELKAYKERIFQELLVKRPPRWSNDEKKQYAIQLLKDADSDVAELVTSVKNLQATVKELKESKDALLTMLKNYHLLTDEDLNS